MTAQASFSPATQAWLDAAFAAPTPAQSQAWRAITSGEHVLVVAPTGSGKTLAAFLSALDRLHTEPVPDDPRHRCRVLYVSPLKALAVDVDRNLASPLRGIALQAERLGVPVPDVSVAIRTGDTPAAERSRFAKHPSDILITTPESLFLLLTSAGREALTGVHTVIVDEVHAMAGTKRGAHLAVSLERLDALLPEPAQRIGLSATVRPVDEVAAFLSPTRPATVVAPKSDKAWDLRIEVPVEDLGAIGTSTGEVVGSAAGAEARSSLWPHIESRLVEIIEAHRTTLVFANSRRLAERLTAAINEIALERGAAEPIARAHHGSVSREQRAVIEDDLKSGRLPAVVATSSLELGIDMGAVDVVVQVETPPSVASGLQRVGRAGHQVGAVSRGVVFPKYRGDLVTCSVVVERMLAGGIEALRIPRNPLDVLAQQVVAAVSLDDWTVDDLFALVRRSAPFTGLTPAVFESVLDMLSGRYPSDAFASLKPRLVWDRAAGTLTGRPGAQRLAVTSGGTIPDRGLFGVFLVGEKASRVGELDEEMVYESRVGEVIALGASSWRIEQITHDRVLVSPAPGQPGRLPFWHGDALGRPAELGAAVGAFVRALAHAKPAAAAQRLAAAGLDERAADNLLAYLHEQRQATGRLPDDRTVVIERFRDELGDWRVVVHSPFGAGVHAPWALALAARLHELTGLEAQVMHADDGIVLRLPDAESDEQVRAVAEALIIEPEDVERLVTDHVAGSALFASRFREAAARALLLPRRHPGKRSPLWQQRQRSAHLLDVAAGFPSFPIVLETVRECLQDVYDVPALVDIAERIRQGAITVVEVETPTPSPFARSLLFGYVASYLYEGDSPLAERRAQALTLDTSLLAELLGTPVLRDLLDAEAIDEVAAQLQHLTPERQASGVEDAADLLRILGPLGDDQAAARGITAEWLAQLRDARRAIAVRVNGLDCTAAIEDAARLRDALGVALPPGIPEELLEPVADPIGDLVHRFARTHGPFDLATLGDALGLPAAVARQALQQLVGSGRLVAGEFRPGGSGQEWCDVEVLRRIRRRRVARLRHEAEPVAPADFAAFLLQWQGVAAVDDTPTRVGADGVLACVEQLAGVPLPASVWESAVLPSRVRDYHPGLLDELTTAGEVAWWGAGQLARGDGLVALAPADVADALRLPVSPPDDLAGADLDEVEAAVLASLGSTGGYFFRDIADRVGVLDDARIDAALWSLTWRGLVTNDSWAGLRVRAGGRGGRAGRTPRARTRPGRLSLPRRTGPPTAAGRWSVLPTVTASAEQRAHLAGEVLLGRYGIVTRGSVAAERLPGGFAAAYRVLSAFEQAGRCQRAYAIEGLGAAQFALPHAVDRVRGVRAGQAGPRVTVLSAVDPASAFGAALPGPDAPTSDVTHRPGRKAGALVVLVDGELAVFVEKGGATLLAWAEGATLTSALHGLGASPLLDSVGRVAVTSVNGRLPADDDDIGRALASAGFVHTPSGWRHRARG